ncbi:MAG: hypothetical protein KGI58_02215 [Patescibacteria group bacterium]|nr:hypothetical protein [Patescibacteria group bacterium]
MKKYLFIAFVCFLTLCSSVSYASVVPTTGFIPGPIWYSKETLNQNDNVKIHTAVWNGGSESLSVKVEFYDKSTILGTRDVTVLPSELKDVYISWQVTSGDHIISAQIVSSTTSISGKNEPTSVSVSQTMQDHKFIPVTIEKVDGVPISSAEIIKNQIKAATAGLDNIIPTNISSKVSDKINTIDGLRSDTYIKIKDASTATQNEIKILNDPKKSKTINNSKALDATQEPIAYVKLFFLSVLEFIFGNKLIFYGLGAFILFIILRYIYRKIRNI